MGAHFCNIKGGTRSRFRAAAAWSHGIAPVNAPNNLRVMFAVNDIATRLNRSQNAARSSQPK
jgi:hypothetical protein